MPATALARSLPKPIPEFGTVTLTDTGAAWNVANITLTPEVKGEDFWLVAWSCDALAYLFQMGVNQTPNANLSCLGMQHVSGGGSCAVGIVREIPGIAWNSTFDISSGSGTFRAAVGLRFKPTKGFRGEPTAFARFSSGGSPITITPPLNPGPPGGLAFAWASMHSGGAGPNSGPAAPWVQLGSGGLLTCAYYILPTDRILTPPAFTFGSSRGAVWFGGFVYLR
jgi:hypothetical protein